MEVLQEGVSYPQPSEEETKEAVQEVMNELSVMMDQATQTPPSPPPPPPEDDIEPFTRMVRFANMFRTPDGVLPSSSGSFGGARVPKKGWEYVKCPMYPCLLFCAKGKALDYTREVYRQPHADVRNMWSCLLCFCRQPATLQQSHSQDNPRQLFLTCSKKECNFFRWADKPLGQKYWNWLQN